ncbi:hypothetical protein GGX14DRAFT_546787 [Mycena pura]|uniref:Uncharacterized protein n=1 Tax=Mycena pura TaxID=153505 RepID=A0AAD6UQR6_9AGAR|nr:hypothetical protein GGX14DRAFT_546787 [Mycena pura]
MRILSSKKQASPAVNFGVPLHRCECRSQSPAAASARWAAPSASSSSAESSSSGETNDGPSSAPKRQVREYPSACMDLVIHGVSTMLLIPKPLLDGVRKGKRRAADEGDDAPAGPRRTETSVFVSDQEDPSAMKRIFSRRRAAPRKQNSLVLPEVPVPVPPPDEPPTPGGSRSGLVVRAAPPPPACRTVRFVGTPRRVCAFAPPPDRAEDAEPAWSDFMHLNNCRSDLSLSSRPSRATDHDHARTGNEMRGNGFKTP